MRLALARPVWVAAERRALFVPDFSLVDIVRGRLEGLGPVTASAIADCLGLGTAAVDAALLALEAEGFAMRGRFTAESADAEALGVDGTPLDGNIKAQGGRCGRGGVVRTAPAGAHSPLYREAPARGNRAGAGA
jgi:hypothetical protein